MIISPYSDSSLFSSNGRWEPTAANFPRVKHFWNCEETSADSSLTDTINGVELTAASLARTSDTFGITTTLTSQETSGTYALDGTKPFAMMTVCHAATMGIRIGKLTTDQANIIIRDATSATAPLVDDGATSRPGTDYTNLLAASTTYGRAIGIKTFNDAAGLLTFECDTGSNLYPLAAAASTTIATFPNSGDTFETGAGGWSAGGTGNLYGIAIFEFDSWPDDFDDALAWMTYQWSIGNKWIYPGWRGLS